MGSKKPSSQRVILAGLSLLLAGLACARADVPLQGGVGSGSILPAGPPIPQDAQGEIVQAAAPPALPSSTPDRPAPLVTATLPPTPTAHSTGPVETLLYETQPGDTLRALAIRFGVTPSDIRSSAGGLPDAHKLLDPGILLIIPSRLENTGPDERLIPDSELIYSPHAAEFDIQAFVDQQGGFLSRYREYVINRQLSGAQVVAKAARDHSINPRVLLAFVEYYTGWVTNPETPPSSARQYPLGILDPDRQGLYKQLVWLINELGKGYYGWRAGTLIDVLLRDGDFVRLAPTLNAGTVALQYYFSQREGRAGWLEALSPDGFIATYRQLFGDPWSYYHPLFEPGVRQPDLILPFLPGQLWSLTGGPHGAWDREAAWGALDFAPAASESGCVPSDAWVVASAAGLVVRSETGLVVIDLDGDGREQTGWVLLYLHMATKDRVRAGRFVEQGDPIGHPSCEGGIATGTHVHIVRKYNGEWVLADGPLPFNLSGWVARAGALPYQGALVRGDETVLACPCASFETLIKR